MSTVAFATTTTAAALLYCIVVHLVVRTALLALLLHFEEFVSAKVWKASYCCGIKNSGTVRFLVLHDESYTSTSYEALQSVRTKIVYDSKSSTAFPSMKNG